MFCDLKKAEMGSERWLTYLGLAHQVDCFLCRGLVHLLWEAGQMMSVGSNSQGGEKCSENTGKPEAR